MEIQARLRLGKDCPLTIFLQLESLMFGNARMDMKISRIRVPWKSIGLWQSLKSLTCLTYADRRMGTCRTNLSNS